MSDGTLPCRCRNPLTRIPNKDGPKDNADDQEIENPDDIIDKLEKQFDNKRSVQMKKMLAGGGSS